MEVAYFTLSEKQLYVNLDRICFCVCVCGGGGGGYSGPSYKIIGGGGGEGLTSMFLRLCVMFEYVYFFLINPHKTKIIKEMSQHAYSKFGVLQLHSDTYVG